MKKSEKKKSRVRAQLFYRRKKKSLFAKELLATSDEKISRRLNFSIGERKNLYSRKNFWPPRMKKSRDGSTFLSAKEKISIRERTFGHLDKKKSRDGSTFLSAKEKISIRERTFGHLDKKKSRDGSTFLSAKEKISIRERTFGHLG